MSFTSKFSFLIHPITRDEFVSARKEYYKKKSIPGNSYDTRFLRYRVKCVKGQWTFQNPYTGGRILNMLRYQWKWSKIAPVDRWSHTKKFSISHIISNMDWKVCVIFDLMKRLDAYTSDKGKLIFFDFLYKAEQRTIFIEIGACWDFDPVQRFWKVHRPFTYFTLYLKNHTSYELTVIYLFVPYNLGINLSALLDHLSKSDICLTCDPVHMMELMDR